MNGKEINLTGDDIIIKSNNFSVDKDGNMTCTNANIQGNITSDNANITGGKIKVYGGNFNDPNFSVLTKDNSGMARISASYMWLDGENKNDAILSLDGNSDGNGGITLSSSSHFNAGQIKVGNGDISNFIALDGINGNISVWGPVYANSFENHSLKELKKNIEKFNINALKEIKESDIYQFNYKTEKDTDKKHIGFIIGKNYKTSDYIISNNKQSIEMYSMISILWKAIQEQQEIIEQMQQEIDDLKKGEK